MEKADPTAVHKVYNRMRLWEFSDQYLVEPTDGSSAPFLSVSRYNASFNLIGTFTLYPLPSTFSLYLAHQPNQSINADDLPQSSSLRAPKIWIIFGVVGTIKLLAGNLIKFLNPINQLIIP